MDFRQLIGLFHHRGLRISFRTYVLVLCMLYLSLAFVFHSRLQYTITVVQNAGTRAEQPDGHTVIFHNHHSTATGNLGLTDRTKSTKVLIIKRDTDQVMDHKVISKSDKQTESPNSKLDQEFNKSPNITSEPCHHQKLNRPLRDAAFQEVAPKVYVYSAYFDSRKKDPFIRIISIMQGRPALYCHFKSSHAKQVTQLVYYEMCENHGRPFKGFILSCPVPDFVTPVCSIEVSTSPYQGRKVQLDVRSIKPKSNPRKFSICVPPLFGPIDRNSLIEFIEMSRLLGAEHFTFYNFDLNPNTVNLLKYYEKKKLVSVIPWRLPFQVDRAVWYHGQLVSIEDCLYRNMGTTDFLTFNDIDEFMVPRRFQNWTELINSLHKDENCGYSFQSAFFDPVQATQARVSGPQNYLRVARNTVRSKVISRIRTKCLVQPRKIFEMGIHHISKPNEEFYKVIKMDTEVALLHHYRKCLPDFGMKCRDFIEDSTGLRYTDHLHSHFQTVLSQIPPH